jgi:hypothetical protein
MPLREQTALCREAMVAYCGNHTEPIDTLCKQNVELSYVSVVSLL